MTNEVRLIHGEYPTYELIKKWSSNLRYIDPNWIVKQSINTQDELFVSPAFVILKRLRLSSLTRIQRDFLNDR